MQKNDILEINWVDIGDADTASWVTEEELMKATSPKCRTVGYYFTTIGHDSIIVSSTLCLDDGDRADNNVIPLGCIVSISNITTGQSETP